jgi:hypothetical protein
LESDGRTLYFLGPRRNPLAVAVTTFPELLRREARSVPQRRRTIRDFQPSPDGRVLILYDDQPAGAPLTLVENWSPGWGAAEDGRICPEPGWND